MSMRSFSDRIRHAVLFELIGIAIFTPAAAWLFNEPVAHMGGGFSAWRAAGGPVEKFEPKKKP